MAPILDFSETAASVWVKLAAMLTRGAADAHHDYHWPTMCTVDAQNQPQARILVLRKLGIDPPQCVFYTDIRSPKIAELIAQPHVALLFYDERTKLQLRAAGPATIECNTPRLQQLFAGLPASAQASYTTTQPPGSSITAGEMIEHTTTAEHFACLTVNLHTIEALDLHREGHRRMLLNLHKNELTWAVP